VDVLKIRVHPGSGNSTAVIILWPTENHTEKDSDNLNASKQIHQVDEAVLVALMYDLRHF
jgi:hypothetical protein